MRRTLNILIVLIVLDLIGGGLLWFGYSNMENKKTERAEIKQELLVEGQKGERLRALRSTLVMAEKDHEALENYLFDPNEESQIAFLSTLELLGIKTTGATTNTTVFELTKTEPKQIHAEMTISGRWESLYHLLRLIETLPTRTLVESFSVKRVQTTPGSENNWTGTMTFGITSIKTDTQK